MRVLCVWERRRDVKDSVAIVGADEYREHGAGSTVCVRRGRRAPAATVRSYRSEAEPAEASAEPQWSSSRRAYRSGAAVGRIEVVPPFEDLDREVREDASEPFGHPSVCSGVLAPPANAEQHRTRDGAQLGAAVGDAPVGAERGGRSGASASSAVAPGVPWCAWTRGPASWAWATTDSRRRRPRARLPGSARGTARATRASATIAEAEGR